MSPATTITVSDELKKRFPGLIDLILASESMNNEERQYWINIIPIMTPEQIKDLTGILENERTQLKAIDEKYAKEMETVGSAEKISRMQEDRKQRREQLRSAEAAHAEGEKAKAESMFEDPKEDR